MTVRIRELDDISAKAWDAYVSGHEDGTFCHRAGWKKAVERGAGHACPYLFAEQDGAIVGVLPLTLRKSMLFGKAAVSSMFCVYGGPLASDLAVYDALDAAAWERTRAFGTDVMEYRTRHPRHAGQQGWVQEDGKSASFFKTLEGRDPDALLLQIPRKQRAVVRKSLKNELQTDWGGDLDSFYRLYALSVRNLGTPVFPKRLFRALFDAFGANVEIQITRTAEGKPVASLMSFYDEKTVYPYYAGGGQAARPLGAHDFMYYELMKRATAKGRNLFDFGRSKVDTGPYRFKKNWGFEPTPLTYEYRLAPDAAVPDMSPQNSKFQTMIAVWIRLPLWLANTLGPPVSRHLG
jgi:FemAB-related protein (PEP-CTERM system-associated)